MIASMTDLLLIVPHPDDEVFGCGGLFSRMASHEKKVATLTLTRGGAGRNLGLCSQEELPSVREAELRASLAALSVPEVHIWDYPDYVPDGDRGMPHRDGLQAIVEEDIVPKIAALIDNLKPKKILTFAPNGSNGHPDHVYTHLFALKAIDQAKHKLEKLFYFAGEHPYNGPARAGFMAPEEIAGKHAYASHFIHLELELEAKLKAMGEHKTQAFSVLSFMQKFPRRLMVESFHQARPELPNGEGPRTVHFL